MSTPVEIDSPPESTPSMIWALEQMRRMAQRIYELEEKLEELTNGSGNS